MSDRAPTGTPESPVPTTPDPCAPVLIERGKRRCKRCGKPHDRYRNHPQSKYIYGSWADLTDGHIYEAEDWESYGDWRAEEAVAAQRDRLAARELDALVAAMNEAYAYQDRDNGVPVLPFVDDIEGFWEPFARAVLALLDTPAPARETDR